jgi:hypothetical protein
MSLKEFDVARLMIGFQNPKFQTSLNLIIIYGNIFLLVIKNLLMCNLFILQPSPLLPSMLFTCHSPLLRFSHTVGDWEQEQRVG